MSKFGYVYFAQAGKGGHIKIGSAFDPLDRMKTLQTGCPEPLTLLGVIPNYNFREHETHFQKMYAEHCVVGEWFKPIPHLLGIIKWHTGTIKEIEGHTPESFQNFLLHKWYDLGAEQTQAEMIRRAKKLMEHYNIPLLELAETLGVTYEEASNA